MEYEAKILVCSLKGTPPEEPDTPAAYTVCSGCLVELVYDARNYAFMVQESLKPYCGRCAADLMCAPAKERIQ